MGLGWSGKKDVIGLIIIILFMPVITIMIAPFVPILDKHPILFGIGCLTVIAAGFIYIIKKKR